MNEYKGEGSFYFNLLNGVIKKEKNLPVGWEKMKVKEKIVSRKRKTIGPRTRKISLPLRKEFLHPKKEIILASVPNYSLIEKEKIRKFSLPLYFGWEIAVQKARNETKLLFWHFRKRWQEALVLVLLVSIVTTSIFLIRQPDPALGASYIWTQSDWSEGVDTEEIALHETNQTNWKKYYSASANIYADADVVRGATSTVSLVQTSDTDFLAGTRSTTTITGTDDNAKLNLQYFSPQWVIDSVGDKGIYSSIDYLNDQRYFISYYDATNQDLMLASTSDGGTTWSTTTIDSVGDKGMYSSIDAYNSSIIGISYYDNTNQDLMYAGTSDGGATWSTTTIDSSAVNCGTHTSLAVASDGLIRYLTYICNGNLKFAKFWATTWSTSIIQQGSGYPTSVKYDASYYPYITFRASAGLIFGKSTSWGDIWSTTTLGSGGDYSSLTLSGSNIFISSHNGSTGNIRFFKSSDGATWSSTTVVNSSTILITPYTSIDAADANNIFIAYRDGSGYLGFATTTDGGNNWTTQAVDDSGYSRTVSLKVINSNNILISYYQSSQEDLKFAKSTNGGSIWNVAGYYATGTFTSSIIDTQGSINWGTMDWSTTTPIGTDVTFKVRSSNSASMTGASAWTSCSNITKGADITGGCVTDGHRYIQFQATLTTINTDTPEINDVTINVVQYLFSSSANLISSSYNTADDANTLTKIVWSENQPANTTISFQIRTSADGITWTPGSGNFCGPDDDDSSTSTCDTDTYFTDNTGGESVDEMFSDGAGDRFVQYKIILSSTDYSQTPSVSSVSMTYVVNSPPEFDTTYGTGGTSIDNSSSTNISISYKARDIDTDVGSLENQWKLWPSFEYSLNGGAWTTISTSTLTGYGPDAANYIPLASPSTSTFVTATTTWNAKSLLSNTYSENLRIRVSLNDHELAHNASTSISEQFILDTKNPAYSGAIPVSVDGSQEPAVFTSYYADDSDLQMRISLNSDFSGASFISAVSTTTIDLASNDPATVYYEFLDLYGNSASSSLTTPEGPENVMVQDLSNSTTSDWRLVVIWDTISEPPAGFKSYNLLRSTDLEGIFETVASSSERTLNYLVDTSVLENTVYYYKVTSQDDNDNISFLSSAVTGKANGIQDSGEGGGGEDNTGPQISDVQVISTTTDSVVISWTTDELSDSTVDYSETSEGEYPSSQPLSTMTRNHSIAFSNLTPDTDYYFRVRSSDPSDNETSDDNSAARYSFRTKAGPKISNTVLEKATNYTAKIFWTTDQISDSYVVFSENSDLSASSSQGSSETGLNHSVTLSGLSQNTKYYYYVQSSDGVNTAYDKNIENGTVNYFEFITTQDEVAPNISSISTISTEGTTIISWETSEDASSTVEYGTTVAYGNASSSDTFTKIHQITLSLLGSDTTYHYRIISTDVNANTTTTEDFTFETEDTAAPVISSIASSTASTTADITWETDEDSDSWVDYGTTNSYGTTVGSFETDTFHSVSISGLSEGATYYFKVNSRDEQGNLASDDNEGQGYTFFTTQDLTSPVISSVTAATVVDTQVTIIWRTNELSTSQVYYGTTNSFGSQTTEDSILTFQHSVTITGLTKSTTYYYKVASKDASDNYAEDDNSDQGYSFATTKTPGEVVTIIAGGGGGYRDSTSPSISNIIIKEADQGEVLVSWQTDEISNTFVSYGLKSNEYSYLAGNYDVTDTKHEVLIKNLSSGLLYYLRVASADKSGNLSKSDEKQFSIKDGTSTASSLDNENYFARDIIETLQKITSPLTITNLSGIFEETAQKLVSPPVISGDDLIVKVTANTAEISWVTDKSSNSLIAYSKDNEFNPTKEDPYSIVVGNPDQFTERHVVKLVDLSPSTVYHYQLRSKGKIGGETRGEDLTFKTSSLSLEISDINLEKNNDSSVKVFWKTNLPTKTFVDYTDNGTGEVRQEKQESFLTDHEIIISELSANTFYSLKIKAIDEKNEETSSPEISFSTGKDLIPPEISQIRVDSAISPRGDRVQVIISWKTDELSTSQIIFQEGSGSTGNLQETQKDRVLTLNHVVVISSFKPASVYRFKVQSQDISGNIATSKEFTILTPQRKQTIIEIITTQFEDIFGWTRQIGI